MGVTIVPQVSTQAPTPHFRLSHGSYAYSLYTQIASMYKHQPLFFSHKFQTPMVIIRDTTVVVVVGAEGVTHTREDSCAFGSRATAAKERKNLKMQLN